MRAAERRGAERSGDDGEKGGDEEDGLGRGLR